MADVINDKPDVTWQESLWSSTSATKSRRATGGVNIDPMDSYFRDIEKNGVHPGDTSIRLSLRLIQHRTHMRRILFSHPPIADEALDIAGKVINRELPPSRVLNAPGNGQFDEEKMFNLAQANAPTIRDLLEQVQDETKEVLFGGMRNKNVIERLEEKRRHIGTLVDELGFSKLDEWGLMLTDSAEKSRAMGQSIFNTRDAAQRKVLQSERRHHLSLMCETGDSLSARAAAYEREKSLYLETKNELVSGNLRLVMAVAKKYNNGYNAMPDLVNEGNIGLMRAADKFEPQMGNQFSTYAMWWIRQAISRAAAEQSRTIRVPHHALTAAISSNKKEGSLAQDLGRKPTRQEVADESDVELEALQVQNRSFTPVLSLNYHPDNDTEFGNMIADERGHSIDEEVLRLERKEQLKKALRLLDERERAILTMRYGLEDGVELTLQEVGDRLDVTRERIRQLEARAFKNLLKRLGRFGMEHLKEYNGDGSVLLPDEDDTKPRRKRQKNGSLT